MLTGDIRPLGDYILVHRDPKPEKSAGGILMPDTAKPEGLVTGTVLAVGPGHIEQGHLTEPRVRVGDRVAFERDAAYFVAVSEDRLLIRERALLCVVEAIA